MKASLTKIIIFGEAIDKLKAFYVENFDLTVIEEVRHEWVVLNAGAVEIGLHRIGEAYRTGDGGGFKADGNTKLVFEVNTDLGLLRQTLIGQGISMRQIKLFAGAHTLFCDGEDPEGNVFQLKQAHSFV